MTKYIKSFEDIKYIIDNQLEVTDYRNSKMSHVEFMRLSLISLLYIMEKAWWKYEAEEILSSEDSLTLTQ